MKEVKTQKKYKCDFCKKRGIKRKIAWHEGNCYRNPNRICSTCNNTGKYDCDVGDDNGTIVEMDCQYCASFDANKLKEIEEYEKSK